MLANLLSGISFGWWLSKHTRHHVHTNEDGKDPDMVAGALVYTPRQAEALGGVARRLASVQQITLIPLLFLEAANLHAASVGALARRPAIDGPSSRRHCSSPTWLSSSWPRS